MKRILLVKIGAIGDTVDSVCWPELLTKEGFSIDFITNKGTEIIWGHNKFIKKLFILQIPSLKSINSIKNFLKFIFYFKFKTINKKYNYIFIFNANLNLIRIISLLNLQRVYHFSHFYKNSKWSQKIRTDIQRTRQEEHLLKRAGLKIKSPKSLLLNLEESPVDFKINFKNRIIAIAVGGGNPISNANTRSLTKEFLFNFIKAQNKSTTVFLLGKGNSDLERVASLKDLISKNKIDLQIELIDLIDKLSLNQVFFLLKKANIFIGGDTGLSKLAAASGVKSLILFGPTSSMLAAPIGKNVISLDTSYSCKSCYAPQEGTYSTMYSCKDIGCMKWHDDKISLINNLLNEK